MQTEMVVLDDTILVRYFGLPEEVSSEDVSDQVYRSDPLYRRKDYWEAARRLKKILEELSKDPANERDLKIWKYLYGKGLADTISKYWEMMRSLEDLQAAEHRLVSQLEEYQKLLDEGHPEKNEIQKEIRYIKDLLKEKESVISELTKLRESMLDQIVDLMNELAENLEKRGLSDSLSNPVEESAPLLMRRGTRKVRSHPSYEDIFYSSYFRILEATRDDSALIPPDFESAFEETQELIDLLTEPEEVGYESGKRLVPKKPVPFRKAKSKDDNKQQQQQQDNQQQSNQNQSSQDSSSEDPGVVKKRRKQVQMDQKSGASAGGEDQEEQEREESEAGDSEKDPKDEKRSDQKRKGKSGDRDEDQEGEGEEDSEADDSEKKRPSDSEGEKEREDREGGKEDKESKKRRDSKGSDAEDNVHRFKYPEVEVEDDEEEGFRFTWDKQGSPLDNSPQDPGSEFEPNNLVSWISREEYRQAAQGIKVNPVIIRSLAQFLEAYFSSLFKTYPDVKYDPNLVNRRYPSIEREMFGRKTKTRVMGRTVLQISYNFDYTHWMMDTSGSMDYDILPSVLEAYRRALKKVLGQNRIRGATVVYHSGHIAAVKGVLTDADLRLLAPATLGLRKQGKNSDGSNGSEIDLLRYWYKLILAIGAGSRYRAPMIWLTDLNWHLPVQISRQLKEIPVLLILQPNFNIHNLKLLLKKHQLYLVAVAYRENGIPYRVYISEKVDPAVASDIKNAASKAKMVVVDGKRMEDE